MAQRHPAPTHYDELGVTPTAHASEIRSVYLGLARRHHPDRLAQADLADRSAGASRMARINAAWSVLSDEDARRAYDQSIGLAGHADSSATIRSTSDTWTPLDDDDVDFEALDDTPTGAPNIPRALTFLPAGFGLAAIVTTAIGVLMTTPSIVVMGGALGAAAVVTFVLAPVLAMINSARDDNEHR